MSKLNILPYNPKLKEKASWLRKNMPPAEVYLWQKLKNKRFLGYKFIRQKPILNYIVDFYCKELKLIIEIDGFTHNYKINYDKKRESDLEELELNIIRFKDREVLKNIDNILLRLELWIGQHTPNPSQEGKPRTYSLLEEGREV